MFIRFFALVSSMLVHFKYLSTYSINFLVTLVIARATFERIDGFNIIETIDRVVQVNRFDTVKLFDKLYHVHNVDSVNQRQS